MDFTPKNATKYYCQICDFKCSKLCDLDRHKSTAKHKNRTKLNVLEQNFTPFTPNFICNNCKKYIMPETVYGITTKNVKKKKHFQT